ncbi:MAG: DUF1343 domain-containing protein [Myxococcales bacterium]
MTVQSGLEVLSSRGFAQLKGLRVGAICNPTAVDRDFRHLADLLRAAPGVTLAALFGPEHGIRGDAQDMIGVVGEQTDARTGVRVTSLYGEKFESLSPTPETLKGLDALVFDIQDVGSRYYTFVYTMALCMKAAAQAKLKFFVLDRPNPIGLAAVEGNLVHPGYESFVGMFPLPNRHGMTAGELARHFNSHHGIGCELEVVSCEGLTRELSYEETGLPFVQPSPNMPTVDTAIVYPGLCMVEGTNLSEGRGTTRPFEIIGAPFLDPYRFCDALAAERLPGVKFRPLSFLPTFHKHAGKSCGGAMIHVTDRRAFLPVRTGVAVLRAARQVGGEAFRWRTERYEFVDDKPAIDLLCGTDAVRKAIDAGQSLDGCCVGFGEELRVSCRCVPGRPSTDRPSKRDPRTKVSTGTRAGLELPAFKTHHAARGQPCTSRSSMPSSPSPAPTASRRSCSRPRPSTSRGPARSSRTTAPSRCGWRASSTTTSSTASCPSTARPPPRSSWPSPRASPTPTSPSAAAWWRRCTRCGRSARISKDLIRLRDLFNGKDIDVFERRQPAGLKKGDIIEARLVPFEGRFFFSPAFCFHPIEAKKPIAKELKRLKKEQPGFSTRDFIWTVAKMRLKCERYRNIAVTDIYAFDRKTI